MEEYINLNIHVRCIKLGIFSTDCPFGLTKPMSRCSIKIFACRNAVFVSRRIIRVAVPEAIFETLRLDRNAVPASFSPANESLCLRSNRGLSFPRAVPLTSVERVLEFNVSACSTGRFARNRLVNAIDCSSGKRAERCRSRHVGDGKLIICALNM